MSFQCLECTLPIVRFFIRFCDKTMLCQDLKNLNIAVGQAHAVKKLGSANKGFALDDVMQNIHRGEVTNHSLYAFDGNKKGDDFQDDSM